MQAVGVGKAKKPQGTSWEKGKFVEEKNDAKEEGVSGVRKRLTS